MAFAATSEPDGDSSEAIFLLGDIVSNWILILSKVPVRLVGEDFKGDVYIYTQ